MEQIVAKAASRLSNETIAPLFQRLDIDSTFLSGIEVGWKKLLRLGFKSDENLIPVTLQIPVSKSPSHCQTLGVQE